ncbi:MAG TPA: hypothetical protein VFC63_26915, partial [Blastocatellia bacterium]|nr:hypothetical protein [Blastocatellia bacterium]
MKKKSLNLALASVFAIAIAFLLLGFKPAPQSDYLLVVNKSDSTLTIIDAATHEVKATVPTGQGPHEVSASPNGRYAYVSNYIGTREDRGHTITVIDLDNFKALDPIELLPNRAPHGSLVSSDGKWLWVTTEVSQ